MKSALKRYAASLEEIRQAGTYKAERIITTPQRARIDTTAARRVVNMCANNYLGLSDRPELIEAAKASYDQWGFGLSSVRFICGTQSIHKELEGALAEFLGMEDAILYSSCFDANGGLFETLLGSADAVISDELTPPSSTACVCARPSATAIRTATWTICAASWRTPGIPAAPSSSSPPTACSPWTAMSPT